MLPLFRVQNWITFLKSMSSENTYFWQRDLPLNIFASLYLQVFIKCSKFPRLVSKGYTCVGVHGTGAVFNLGELSSVGQGSATSTAANTGTHRGKHV